MQIHGATTEQIDAGRMTTNKLVGRNERAMSRPSTLLPRLCIDDLLYVPIESHGVAVTLAANSEQLLAEMCAHLPPSARIVEPLNKRTQAHKRFTILEKSHTVAHDDSSQTIYELYDDEALIWRACRREAIGEIFESKLQLHVAEYSPAFIFVHAGVVSWQGRAVLFPGDSMSGKTTIVTELARCGADYFSDEYALLDKEGRVHPFPKSPAVRERAGSKQQTVRPIEFFGGRAVGEDVALPVWLVLACKYQAQATWHARRLSAGNGALRLLRHTVGARLQPDVALQTLSTVAASAPVYEVTRGAAHESVKDVLQLLAAHGKPSAT